MHTYLSKPTLQLYDRCSLKVSDFEKEKESQEYYACNYKVDGKLVLSRNSKVTPKKVGQFVTFWKRNDKGPIEPFQEKDSFYYLVVNVSSEDEFGQFVFPKSELVKRGIVSTNSSEGKRAFRVYPPWDVTTSQQAIRTQKWQSDYFLKIENELDLGRVKRLYGTQ